MRSAESTEPTHDGYLISGIWFQSIQVFPAVHSLSILMGWGSNTPHKQAHIGNKNKQVRNQ